LQAGWARPPEPCPWHLICYQFGVVSESHHIRHGCFTSIAHPTLASGWRRNVCHRLLLDCRPTCSR
jgi:hypothetical protein